MRNLNTLDRYRITGPHVVAYFGTTGDSSCGLFRLPSPIDRAPLLVMASTGEGWDHVSVSRANRCPNWPEMSFIKRHFFEDNEVAMELHVPAADHINHAEFCLHLWRPNNGLVIPLPPAILVGPVGAPDA